MDFFEEVKERFIRYAKINTRSDETSRQFLRQNVSLIY